jgi:hypothetical protein
VQGFSLHDSASAQRIPLHTGETPHGNKPRTCGISARNELARPPTIVRYFSSFRFITPVWASEIAQSLRETADKNETKQNFNEKIRADGQKGGDYHQSHLLTTRNRKRIVISRDLRLTHFSLVRASATTYFQFRKQNEIFFIIFKSC